MLGQSAVAQVQTLVSGRGRGRGRGITPADSTGAAVPTAAVSNLVPTEDVDGCIISAPRPSGALDGDLRLAMELQAQFDAEDAQAEAAAAASARVDTFGRGRGRGRGRAVSAQENTVAGSGEGRGRGRQRNTGDAGRATAREQRSLDLAQR